MAALTRIRNNQVESHSIHANKIQLNTITGDLFANNLIYNGTLTVSNLQVYGNSTVINSTNTTISDAVIELNAEYTGVPTFDTGVIFGRGSSDNVALVWNENYQYFHLIFTTTSANSAPGPITANAYADLHIGNLNLAGNVNTSNWVNTTNISLTGSLFANANAGAIGQYLASDGTNAYWASHFFNEATPPETPNYGDVWYYLDENKLYMWVTDGEGEFWYDFLPPTF